MRVAHVLRKYNPAEWGGTETAVQQLLDGLKRQGVDGTVYCPKLDPAPSRDPLQERGHAVLRYGAFIPVWNLSPEQRVQLIAKGGNLMSFSLWWRLSRERGLSVIHTHALNRIGGIALTAARTRRIPFVVTIHGGVLDLPNSVRQSLAAPSEGGIEWGKFLGAIFRSRRVLKEADAIVTCNAREATLQLERYPGKRVVVQPHGVPVALFGEDHRARALEAYPTLANRKILLIVGRIEPVKNQGWVLAQMPEVLAKHPGIVLVLAGACIDELYGKALRKEIRRLGIERKVLFTGGLPPADPRLIGLMQIAASVIVPSIAETFGLVILEAWAAGAVVLSTRTSGALSIMRDGENGLFFDPRRPAGFHERLNEILNEPSRAREMAENGRQLAARNYDIFALSGRMKSLYEELIREKHTLRHHSGR